MGALQVKNMVCPRCITSVAAILDELAIEYDNLLLGSFVPKKILSCQKKEHLKTKLHSMGFELLENPKDNIVNQIKSILIEQIHYPDAVKSFSISAILVQKIYKDYSTLSKTFSKSEGMTIEQYVILQKIERAKELLSYNQLSIAEIAVALAYSSTAHFSRQFKKHTNQTPSKYSRNIKEQHRKSLDEI